MSPVTIGHSVGEQVPRRCVGSAGHSGEHYREFNFWVVRWKGDEMTGAAVDVTVAKVHESSYGTYHPDPDGLVAWTINDTRGYLDGGPPCDRCGACECEPKCGDECIGLSFAFVCLDGGEALCSDCGDTEGIKIVPCTCG